MTKKNYPLAVIPVRGAGGGGGSGHTPQEANDTLRSKQIANIVDLLCEGPIEGLVGGAKGIYLDDSPLVNFDGTQNFSTLSAQWRTGTQAQTALDGFTDVQAETIVNTEVKFGVPITRNLSSGQYNTLRVTVSTPNLTEQTKDGDLIGSSVTYEIYIQKDNAGFPSTPAVRDTIAGKTVANYRRSHLIALPESLTGTWDVRIVRITADSTSVQIQNRLIFESFTGIIETQLSYPNSAVVGLRFDSSQFNAIPSRAFRIKGLIVRVPSNYTPAQYDRVNDIWTPAIYSGMWDGTFKLAWTSNPAWCFYDLLLSERYGLGDFIDPGSVDKWSLYTIARYCDAMIPAGWGVKTEPRFTCNLYMQTREEAYKVIQNFASIFRAITFWGASSLLTVQDTPRDPVAIFTNANAIDGDFSYSGSSIKQRHTVALVSWNDPNDMYRQKVEYVPDEEGIRTLGVIDTNMVAFGCSSRGQAHRIGKWMLATERLATETVMFKTGNDAVTLSPGDIIAVSDMNRAQVRMGGRAVKVINDQVTLDAPFTINPGEGYFIRLMSTTSDSPETPPVAVNLPIITGPGTYTTLQTSVTIPGTFSERPVFVIAASDVAPELWRVLSVKDEGEGIMEVSGVAHVPGLYDFVERDIQFVSPPITNVNTTPNPPTDLRVVTANYLIDGTTVGMRATFSWVGNGARYRYGWRRKNGLWQEATTSEVSVDIPALDYAVYDFYVVAISAIGRESNMAYLEQSMQPAPTVLPVVTNLRLEAPFTASSAKYIWDATKGADSYEVKVKVGASPFLVRTVIVGDALRYEYTAEDMRLDGGPWRTITVEVTALGKFNARSSAPAILQVGNPQIGALNGLQIDPGYGTIFVKYARPADEDFAGVLVWVGMTPDFLPSADSLVFDGSDMVIVLRGMKDGSAFLNNTEYFVRIAAYDDFGKDELSVSNSFSVTPLSAALGPNSITAEMLKDGILSVAKFAQGVEPLVIVTSVPTVKSTNTIFNAADGKIYTWDVAQGKYTTQSFDLGDLTGTLKDAQIESIAASKVTGQMRDDQIAQVDAAKLLGQLTAGQIAAGAIDITKFANNLQPVMGVDSLPTSNVGADVIMNRADGLLYRWSDTKYVAVNDLTAMTGALPGAQIESIPAAKVTGQIVSNQIASVEGQKITGLLTQAQIEAAKVTGQMVASQIQDGAILHDKIAAGAVYTENIAAGAITARTLAIGDFENLINCGTSTDGFVGNVIANNNPGDWQTNWWQGIGASSPYTFNLRGRDTYFGAKIPVSAADQFYASILSVPSGGGPSLYQLTLGLAYYNAAGDITFWRPVAIRPAGTSGARKDESTVPIPNASVVAVRAWMQIAISAGQDENAVGAYFHIGGLQLRRRNGGNLIVDGAITTDKLAANSIDATKIQAGAITAGKIAAGSITTAELSIGVNGNLLRYSTFPLNIRGWELAGNTGLQAPFEKKTAPYTFNNETVGYQIGGTPVSGTYVRISHTELIGVAEFTYYEFSAYLNTHRCKAAVYIEFLNSSGALLSTGISPFADNVNTVADQLKLYQRKFVNLMAPAGAVSARFIVYIEYQGLTSPACFFLRCYAAQSSAGVVTPAAWAPMGVTQIDGQIITTRTIAAEQIMAETITANELSANSVTTNKLLVTGKGKALNDDPGMLDPSAWTLAPIGVGATGVFQAMNSPLGGTRCFVATGGMNITSRKVSVKVGVRYKLEFITMRTVANGVMYFRVHMRNAAGTLISYTVTGLYPYTGTFESLSVGSTWVRYSGYIDAPAGAATAEISAVMNNPETGGAAGVSYLGDFRLEEYIGADLIVDGAISARHISAGSITADKIVGGTITGDKIAANAITANNLAANSVTAGKIAANAITATEIAAGAITASKLAIGDVTNMCTNPNGDSGLDGWSGISSVVINSSPGLPNGVKVLVNTSRDSFFGNAIDCKVGTQFAVSADVLNGNSNSNIYFGFIETDAAGSVLAYNSTGASCLAANGLNSWKTIKGICTISNANTARVRIYVQIQGFGADIGTWYMHNVNYRRAANGELIVDGSITADKIAVGAVTAGKIAAGAVVAGTIAADAVTSVTIAAGSITTAKLAVGSVTADKIVGGTITGDKIAANTITADRLVTNSITANQLAAGAVTAGKIAAGAVSATEIAAGAITTDKLAVIARGSAINNNPECTDITAWGDTIQATMVNLSGAAVSGTGGFQSNAVANSATVTSKVFPLSVGKTYRVSAWLRTVNGNGNPTTAYLRCFRMNGSLQDIAFDTQMEGMVVNEYWVNYVGTFTAESGTSMGLLRAYLNWNAPVAGSVMWMQDFRIEEVLPGTLIKDGAITTQKIQAAAITGDKIAGNTITGDKIIGNTITGDKIVANTLNGDRIIAGTLDASKVTAGTFQTAYSGRRAVVDGSTNTFRAWNASGSICAQIGEAATGTIGLMSLDASADLSRYCIDTVGNVAINQGILNITGRQGQALTAAGYCYMGTVRPYNGGSYTIGDSGGQSFDGAYFRTAPVITSDIRTKKDVETLELGLTFIEKLRPVSYRFIVGKITEVEGPAAHGPIRPHDLPLGNTTIQTMHEGKRTHYGLIAQEVKEALGDVDSGVWSLADPGDPNSAQALRYEELIAPLINAVKELSGTVRALQGEVAELTKKLEEK